MQRRENNEFVLRSSRTNSWEERERISQISSKSKLRRKHLKREQKKQRSQQSTIYSQVHFQNGWSCFWKENMKQASRKPPWRKWKTKGKAGWNACFAREKSLSGSASWQFIQKDIHDENGVSLSILEQRMILKLSCTTYYEGIKFKAVVRERRPRTTK